MVAYTENTGGSRGTILVSAANIHTAVEAIVEERGMFCPHSGQEYPMLMRTCAPAFGAFLDLPECRDDRKSTLNRFCEDPVQ